MVANKPSVDDMTSRAINLNLTWYGGVRCFRAKEPQRRGGEEDHVVVRTEALRESLRTREDKVTTPR